MITIKAFPYTTKNLIDLRDILRIGLDRLRNDLGIPGDGVSCTVYLNCEECLHRFLCRDLETTIQWLNEQIARRTNKFTDC